MKTEKEVTTVKTQRIHLPLGENEEGENEMKKILNRLFVIASLGLIVAGAIFLCVSIFDGNETTTPLAIALACILLSNLFNVIRMNMDKK